MVDLSIKLCGTELKNPVIPASGTFGFGREYNEIYDISVLGGVSGAGIKPIAVRMVYEASCAVSIPVVGMGGITCAEDAIEFLMAGATAVEVGTHNFTDPLACPKIIDGLRDWCMRHGVARVSELTGTLKLN